MIEVHRHYTASSFLHRAAEWLLREEEEHGLILGVASALLGDHRYHAPIFLATLQDGGGVVGCALRTPPYHALLTKMPAASMPALVDTMAEVYGALPGVQGPPQEAEAFAAAWCTRFDMTYSTSFRMLIHVLRRVIHPVLPVPGALRRAEQSDLGIVDEWASAFVRDTGIDARPEDFGELLLAAGMLYLWDDDGPRSMAGVNRQTANGATVSAVYTPQRFRGRGYASAAVAALSQKILDGGRRFCTLYTDVANPTSNKIYRAVGYEPVAGHVHLRLTPRA